MISSIGYSDEEIISNILKLHCSGNIDIDPTYSKGNFYKGLIEPPKLKFDINPQLPDVVKADCRNLPLADASFETIMFDPPFLATTGPSLKNNLNGNIINKRFGVYDNELDLHNMYHDSLIEFYRILKDNGILIFKCQDKVSSGKQYLSHVFIINKAAEIGFYPKDLFILVAKNRIVANWQKNQQHCRKYHCYFLI